MKTYQQIKNEYRDNLNALMEKNGVFWAFSNERLDKHKKDNNIVDNKDLISIGMGGFMPKINADNFFKEMDAEDKRFKKALKDASTEKENAIKYELDNFECFYSGDLTEVFKTFKGVYTPASILKVYKKFKNLIEM